MQGRVAVETVAQYPAAAFLRSLKLTTPSVCYVAAVMPATSPM
ncbi:MAG: hypothetical protein WA988_11865 [Candidatus Nanopelagicales bacterium]